VASKGINHLASSGRGRKSSGSLSVARSSLGSCRKSETYDSAIRRRATAFSPGLSHARRGTWCGSPARGARESSMRGRSDASVRRRESRPSPCRQSVAFPDSMSGLPASAAPRRPIARRRLPIWGKCLPAI